MQFIDLQKQYQKLKKEIDDSIHNVLNQSNYIMGKQVSDLEEQLADYVGVKHCISCGNGTDALSLAMMAYDIKAGDAVFVPTFTFYASAETISLTGATPVFIDANKDTFNINHIDLEVAINNIIAEGELKPRAIVAVDLFGLPYDIEKISTIAEKYNLLVIEDGAQGFGGSVKGRKSCSFGDIATTSFFPAKPLGGYGDGGAVFTNESKVREYIESVKVHGKGIDKYDNVRVGVNSRLDTLQAAVLIPKLKAFRDYELDLRNELAMLYSKLLKDFVKTPNIPDHYISSYAQYSIILKSETERDKLQISLKEAGIPTMIYYKTCMHQQTVYRNNPYIYRGFYNSEEISKTILNLPMHPYLERQDVEFICKTIKGSI